MPVAQRFMWENYAVLHFTGKKQRPLAWKLRKVPKLIKSFGDPLREMGHHRDIQCWELATFGVVEFAQEPTGFPLSGKEEYHVKRVHAAKELSPGRLQASFRESRMRVADLHQTGLEVPQDKNSQAPLLCPPQRTKRA